MNGSGSDIQRAVSATPCKAKCAGGRRCVCQGNTHTYHICRDPACLCHQPHGYGLQLQQGWHGVLRYVKAGEVSG